MKELIDRQAAIDELTKHLRTTDVPASYPGIITALTKWLDELPSAQPEIVRILKGAPMRYKHNCPYCSAPMRYKRNCHYCGLEIGFMEDLDDGVTIGQERRTDGSD